MTATVARAEGRPSRQQRMVALAPGLALAGAIAAVATAIGRLAPVLGAPVAGLVMGVALSGRLHGRAALTPGVRFAGTTLLQVAVVLLGSALSLRQVARVGATSVPVMLGTLTVCLSLAFLIGRRLGIGRDLRTLIGVGTGICGASAIAAISPVIRARNPDVAYAISTIFLFNIAAVIAFPPLGHLLGLDQHAFGLFAGTAVNDTSSVVAAATTYGTDAANYAIVVKLTRSLMIIPICLALAAITNRGSKIGSWWSRAARLVPWFLIGFVLVAAINSAGLIPSVAHAPLRTASTFLITVALTALGLGTDVSGMRRAGLRPLLLGLVLWIAVASTSLGLQWAAG
ncbi:MAG: YeiH family protein [Jatrophihabitantaceae bacterium]